MQLIGILESRDCLLSRIMAAIDWVSERCFYCQKCRECAITSRLQKEVTRKDLKTFDSHVKWWSVAWVDDLPVLKPHP